MPSEGEEGGRKWAGEKGRDPTLWALWTTSKDNAKEINNYETEPSHFLSYEMWKRADSHKGTAISSAVTRAQNTPGTQHFYPGTLTYLAAPCLSQKHPEPGPGSDSGQCQVPPEEGTATYGSRVEGYAWGEIVLPSNHEFLKGV
ncbi:hypothetical protein mRhiFer1_009812 [Rhinolophus ferrumequinum]|uniref:Uncharacterized protein n=1 Tax=Rhinolophus ferrumequinum TaxID=59479 RepID=A0A7J7YRQ5_RHIFE|nr:hypothetical protein mRhiFer1_009812 [Rhinolophus ferrumequinum]